MVCILREKDIRAFRQYQLQEEKSRATMQKYQRDLQCFLRWLPADKTIDKEVLISFKEYLLKSLQVSSVNSMLAAINSFLNFMGWPHLRIKRIKTQRRVFCSEKQELTKSEYLRLVKEADRKENIRLSLIMQSLCATGMRISELPFVTVAAVMKGQAEVQLKGKVRTVWLPGKLRTRLLRYIKSEHLADGPVFVTKSGAPVHRSNIWAAMKTLCEKADVQKDKVFPHNLRHLFARTYYQREKDLVKLSDLLGHSNIETTRIYTISTGREHKRQINSLGLVV